MINHIIKLLFYYIINIIYVFASANSMSIIRKDLKLPLKINDSGEQVKNIQEKLISLNYYCGPNGADGQFTNSTEFCIREFQRNNGLNITGEIEELTYHRLFSINNDTLSFQKNITTTQSGSNGLCTMGNIYNAFVENNIIYRKKKREVPYHMKKEVDVNVNDLLTQLGKLYDHTMDSKIGARINSPHLTDLEICYIDSTIVISCYCHETEKHFALAYGDDVSTSIRADPGQVTCTKEFRSSLRSVDHCDSGIFYTEEEAELYIEGEKTHFKKKKIWLWVIIIVVAIVLAIIIFCCSLYWYFIKHHEGSDNS